MHCGTSPNYFRKKLQADFRANRKFLNGHGGTGAGAACSRSGKDPRVGSQGTGPDAAAAASLQQRGRGGAGGAAAPGTFSPEQFSHTEPWLCDQKERNPLVNWLSFSVGNPVIHHQDAFLPRLVVPLHDSNARCMRSPAHISRIVLYIAQGVNSREEEGHHRWGLRPSPSANFFPNLFCLPGLPTHIPWSSPPFCLSWTRPFLPLDLPPPRPTQRW